MDDPRGPRATRLSDKLNLLLAGEPPEVVGAVLTHALAGHITHCKNYDRAESMRFARKAIPPMIAASIKVICQWRASYDAEEQA